MQLKTIGLVALCALAAGAPGAPSASTPSGRTGVVARAPRFERIYPLKPDEGVFAYARISPDGRFLAYASETKATPTSRTISQTQTVVSLADRKVLFTEPGIDAYWSLDGGRMIFLSFKSGPNTVVMRNHTTNTVTRGVAPTSLGDYFSWGMRDGKNLILTIASNYYYLDGDKGVLPAGKVQSCPDIGVGERPLLSKDGTRISTFVRGNVVVRGLTDCTNIINTGMKGAKADFSFDGRYIAFHVPKAVGTGYEIRVVDLQQRTVRTVTSFAGSSLFPSWTRDGRLCFRYDGDDYRGFMMASDVLSVLATPLPKTPEPLPAERSWSDVFPETAAPAHSLNLVMIWGTWSAHSPMALGDLQRARAYFTSQSMDVGVMAATDPGSWESDVMRMLADYRIDVPRIPLGAGRIVLTEAANQIPTTLMFRDGRLVDRRLGAQTFEALREWVRGAQHDGR
jgi:hypothetical protein